LPVVLGWRHPWDHDHGGDIFTEHVHLNTKALEKDWDESWADPGDVDEEEEDEDEGKSWTLLQRENEGFFGSGGLCSGKRFRARAFSTTTRQQSINNLIFLSFVSGTDEDEDEDEDDDE
jgi:hypothetical protein